MLATGNVIRRSGTLQLFTPLIVITELSIEPGLRIDKDKVVYIAKGFLIA
jgi:hypothetical protein